MIITTGLGSGLDIESLVTQLVAAEGDPVALRLAGREAGVQLELSAFGSLQSAVTRFDDALAELLENNGFRQRRAVFADGESTLGATADTSAGVGAYDIEVVALAQAQRLSSAAVNADDDGDDLAVQLGTGTLMLTVGTGDDVQSFTVDVAAPAGEEPAGNTLVALAAAINEDEDNPGIAASVVQADDGAYLVLSSEQTGLANQISLSTDDGDDALKSFAQGFTELQAAADAQVLVDGFAVTSAGNELSGVIAGVTIDISEAQGGDRGRLEVGPDVDNARDSVQEFVDAYNALLETIDSFTGFDPETEQGGVLLGDATVRALTTALRDQLSTPLRDVGAGFRFLADVGITTGTDGRLEIDSERLDAALESDFDAVGRLFTDESSGYAARFTRSVDPYTDDGAVDFIGTRIDGLERQLDDIGEQRDDLVDRLAIVEARYRRQFIALDSLLGALNGESQFLASQLASLPGVTRTPSGS